MKSRGLKKVADAYEPYLQAPWQRTGNEFMRCDGDWVQIIAFNASRFSDQYVPRNCMEFLKMSGVPTGAFLAQELQNANGTQQWLNISDSPANAFVKMSEQFRPSLRKPLDVAEIKALLNVATSYWPHSYALCVMSCEEGHEVDAQRYFNTFIAATLDKPYPWVETRKQELTEVLKLASFPEALSAHLKTVRASKLRALKIRHEI